MKYYIDTEGKKIAQNWCLIQYKCLRCEGTFYKPIERLDEVKCPFKSCQKWIGLFRKKQMIKLNTVFINNTVNIPYKLRHNYGERQKGFISVKIKKLNMALHIVLIAIHQYHVQ
jgi:hypothetical protein